MSDENKQEKKYRTFNIVQQIQFLDKETIKTALEHKSIKRWFYILHDKDIYTEEHINNLQEKFPDNENYKELKPGDLKPAHWDISISTEKNDAENSGASLTIAQVAKWFKVPEARIQIRGGHGAFLDSVQYGTHEKKKQQDAKKYLYPDDEAKANFDFRAALNDREANVKKVFHQIEQH